MTMMVRIFVVALIALACCTYAKRISITLTGPKCETSEECMSGDTCSYGVCLYARSGVVDKRSILLKDGSLCASNKNCKNYCWNQRCTSKSMKGGACDNNSHCFGKMVCKGRRCSNQVRSPKNKKRVVGSRSMPRGFKKRDGKKCVWNVECQGTCVFGKCRTPMDAGGICSFSTDCKGRLVCKNSKCQIDRRLGKSNGSKCKWDYQCKNACIFGTCDKLRVLGQTCVRNIHCNGKLKCKNGRCAKRGF